MRVCSDCKLAKTCDSFQRLNTTIAYVLTHDPLTGITLHYKDIFASMDLVSKVEQIYEKIAESCKHYNKVVKK